MVKVSPTHAGNVPTSDGNGGDTGSLRREDREEPAGDPAALSGAAAQAHFRLQRLESASAPEDPANDPSLRQVGTLNVGDRYASARLNSPATAAAAARGVSATDRMDIHVEPGATPPPPTGEPAPVPRRESEPLAFYSTSSGHMSFSLEVLDEDEEERRRRMMMGASSGGRDSGPLPPLPAAIPNPPGAVPASSLSSGGSQRYVFGIRDVHSMGGTPSLLSIRDASGNVVGRYELPPGNSRLTVDLPPGDYTVEAQSGSRSVGGGGDRLDNFRVEVYSAGPTPSGEGGSGGGSAGGDSAGGGGSS